MPIARSAVLTGRLTADTLRMTVTIVIIVGVGYAVGFRFRNGAGPAIAMVVLAIAFGVAIACVSAWIQAFANNQPVTYVIDTMRALALGGPVAADLWKTLAWLAGIYIVFLPLAVRAYRRAS
jgi:ABC-2 type transport system permease protein